MNSAPPSSTSAAGRESSGDRVSSPAGRPLRSSRMFSDGMDRSVTDTKDMGPLHDSAIQGKVDRLADCKLIYLTEIGGPSAARLVKKGIMPMKVKEITPIESALEQLMQTIKQSPPPWLRKAMNKT